jgi:hypothetical protein
MEHTIVGFMILWMTGENTSYTGVTMEQLAPEQSWVRPGQAVTGAPIHFTSSEKVEILLDGVRFDDGRFAGPGSQQAYETAQAIATTRQSLAQTVLAKQTGGESVSSIVEWLRATAAQTFDASVGLPFNGGGGGRSRRSAPRRVAMRFVLAYESKGETALYDLARKYLEPPPKLYR